MTGHSYRSVSLFTVWCAARFAVRLAVLLVAFLVYFIEFRSSGLDLILKLGLQLLLCQALGLEIILFLLEIVSYLVLEKLDIII